jgi:hypothetical protein
MVQSQKTRIFHPGQDNLPNRRRVLEGKARENAKLFLQTRNNRRPENYKKVSPQTLSILLIFALNTRRKLKYYINSRKHLKNVKPVEILVQLRLI